MSDIGLIEAASGQCRTMADGTLRITFDVEPRHAAAAFAAFSAPGTPAVLARLRTPSDPKPAQPEKPQRERMKPLCERAVYWCADPKFQEWVRPVYDRVMGGNGRGWGDVTPADFGGKLDEYAAHAIKVICRVGSRRDLDTDPIAAAEFKRAIVEPYAAWLKTQPA